MKNKTTFGLSGQVLGYLDDDVFMREISIYFTHGYFSKLSPDEYQPTAIELVFEKRIYK